MGGEIIYAIGALILLGGLIWGITHYQQRSKLANKITEEATREEYEEPQRYDEERRETLEETAKNAEDAKERRDHQH